jgi:hypothetical protein
MAVPARSIILYETSRKGKFWSEKHLSQNIFSHSFSLKDPEKLA